MTSEGRQPDPGADPGAGVEVAPGRRVPDGVLRFSFSRSGGPGGQNVNKLETRCELRVLLTDLPLSARQRERLALAAGRRVNDAGELLLVSESERSQLRNRQECLSRLRELIIAALPEPKVRRKTKPSRASKARRLDAKKARGEIKRGRSSGGWD
ncbi:MAG: aminoacyl-tRNA hydrolase [Phycisphaerae bacterium]|nr:aminoacyl-tRNA hydrolase [Phycisphaerae bacterium]